LVLEHKQDPAKKFNFYEPLANDQKSQAIKMRVF
jgi:hypothetical protein